MCPRDFSDSINDNVEHIYFACDPAYTTYTLRVKFNKQQPDEPPVDQRYALAFSTGPDRQADNPWWNDLNADNKIDDKIDNLIYLLINNDAELQINSNFFEQAFNLSPQRTKLLLDGWDLWKPYLAEPIL